MREILTSVFNFNLLVWMWWMEVFNLFGWAWWIEIDTQQPSCTYYFGPFFSQKEAFDAQSGYIEDLKNEGAQDITVKFKRCKQPTELTIANDLTENRDLKSFIYSSQTY